MIAASELRWRRERDDAENWHLLQLAPAANLGFTEATTYLIEKPRIDCRFYVDDELLSDDSDKSNCWVWKPRFFCGEVTAELVLSENEESILYLLDVSPDLNKLGREAFSQMVRELWEADPHLVIGTEPATIGNRVLGIGEDPWAAFARLRRYGAETIQALEAIRAQPMRKLRGRRDSVAIHQARRVDRHTAALLVRGPAISLFADEMDESSTGETVAFLNVPCVESTLDSAANRAMLALLFTLLRRTRALAQRLELLVNEDQPSETRSSLAARWPRRKQCLKEFEARFKRMLRLQPFSEVEREEITSAGLTAIAADPKYSRAWRLGRKVLREGFDSNVSAERHWISPSWEIYEKWCFLNVGQLLVEQFYDWEWSRKRSPNRWEGFKEGGQAVLLLQPQFSSNKLSVQGHWSISKQRKPDLVLEVKRGEEVRFLVLDAKYRATKANVLDAMESAHIYQDSLRIGNRRPEGSLLIVPAAGGAGWLESREFQQEHRVGVHVMAPGLKSSLPDVIREILIWEEAIKTSNGSKVSDSVD